eukprot:TRINITY_DN698_c0_g1_i2.p1 TRINITY_DN698_c0_g1~~TRINITY_DN698_c0_g1_i2.p1  ORF type:complete len:208 (+),score=99.29 TRINITY_DN698_c0_g1_i2:38-625(+)
MGWFDWLSSTLRYLGLSSKQGKILFLGLDNAGKTTLLGRMKDGKVGSHKPTNHPNKEEFAIGGIQMKAYDLGGHRQARALWKNYFTQVDGIVFLVDAANPERIEESKEQLDLLLNDDMLQTVPFSILGNKVDIPNALPPDVLKQRLGLEGRCTGKQHSDSKAANFRPLEVFMVSVVKGYGYGDAFRWLSHYLEEA